MKKYVLITIIVGFFIGCLCYLGGLNIGRELGSETKIQEQAIIKK